MAKGRKKMELFEPELSSNALRVLESRYLWKGGQGELVETPAELFWRVASSVAKAEPRGRTREMWAKRFYEMMASRRFLPNSPTLMNAGRANGQLSACYVLPVEDSLGSIFETLKNAAIIHQSGGGTGFSFSRIRRKGAIVGTAHGVASGPVSFMKIYDTATETIKQGGARRGANMGILRVDHPDIEDFVNSKRDRTSIVNFNISVGVTDAFMEAVKARKTFELVEPGGYSPAGETRADELFAKIARAAWECGDPGLIFLDRVNRMNPTPRLGSLECTNPCGEQPLLPYESCNLGSLNLNEYFLVGGFAWEKFGEDVADAVRFLDNVIEINVFPVKECERITLGNRKIGLGVMGFADLLLQLGLPYGSEEARTFGEKIMSFLDREARRASTELAEERGPFPNWSGSFWEGLGFKPLRNATVSTVAPTGTISVIAGVSSGIEPIFSGVFYRNVLSGQRLVEVHPAVEKLLRSRGLNVEKISEEEIASALDSAWSPAQAVSIEGHVRMQAAFQRHSDSAVSKTINLAEGATPGDIEKAYLLAYELGCKGITVYRDKSRPTQVLEKGPGAGLEGRCVTC